MADRDFKIILTPSARPSTPCGVTWPLRVARGLFLLTAETLPAIPNHRNNNNACIENRADEEG
jgi:hypothetical protein